MVAAGGRLSAAGRALPPAAPPAGGTALDEVGRRRPTAAAGPRRRRIAGLRLPVIRQSGRGSAGRDSVEAGPLDHVNGSSAAGRIPSPRRYL